MKQHTRLHWEKLRKTRFPERHFQRFPEIAILRPRSPLRRAVRVASRQRPRPHGGRPRLAEELRVTAFFVFVCFFFCSYEMIIDT